MNRLHALLRNGLALLLLLPLGCAAVEGNNEKRDWPLSQLTPAEEQLARDLAEEALFQPEQHIDRSEKIFFTRLQMLPGSTADSPERQVVVTHYRYQGNQAILTTVDLHTQQVVQVERVANLPTALAAEEFQRAVILARADERLLDLFAEYGERLHVEGKLGWPTQVADPSVPHRNVYLLFRVGRNYLSGSRVIVDLVNERVSVEEVPSL